MQTEPSAKATSSDGGHRALPRHAAPSLRSATTTLSSKDHMQHELKRYMRRNVCCLDRQHGCIARTLCRFSESPVLIRSLAVLFEITLAAMLINAVKTVTIKDTFIVTVVVAHIFMYGLICLIPPGYVGDQPEMGDVSSLIICPKCDRPRPLRAHHCSICKHCIRMMDHHCDLTQNCCGEDNVVFYLIYEVWTFVMAFVGAILAGQVAISELHDSILNQATITAVLLMFIALSMAYLVILHLTLVICDKTMLEWFAKTEPLDIRSMTPVILQSRLAQATRRFSRWLN